MSNLTLEQFTEIYLNIANRDVAGYGTNYEKLTSDSVCRRLFKISDKLIDNAKKFNLTSILEPTEIARKHIIDSICPLGLLLEYGITPKRVLDVGTGAGFPLLPMAAVMADISPKTVFLGLDATAKKISHINECAAYAEIPTVSAMQGRAEEVAAGKFREKFDMVTARAVADLTVLIELCAPFVAVGGVFAALKSHADEEISKSESAAKILGLTKEAKIDYEIPGGDSRCLIIYRKISPTPPKYPRRYAEITKQPLL
ncbi:MAG: 16S rRNA (guanine(527)-N(7))-methyltransferase RsmG [Ruminococcaceae bacterium]|nr:16S rRNA (guanine(527)-N(7))-methyltransferase RsmG [Oscillospiraceae bacterium]